MMTPKEIDKKIVLSWLQGKHSISDLRILQEYLNDPAYRESLDKLLQEEWAALREEEQPQMPGLDQQYDRWRARLAPVRPMPAARRRWVAAAAVIIVLGGMAWLLGRRAGSGKEPAWTVLRTAAGERKALYLPDSSLVYLGAASTIKYNPGYNSSDRKILLDGEGYFVVRHDGRRPFTVFTGALSTMDIGTEFNIRHYSGDVVVAVAKGRVEVHVGKGGRVATLGKGQRLQYDGVSAKFTTDSLPDASLAGAWRKGVLSWRRRPLKEVTDELQRYYGVSIHYTDPALQNILITTVLDNRSLDEAVDIVAVTAGVRHYVRQGNTITFQ
ncbi:MAG: FecR domain-containing protein [Bacteroidetes bacterium]|nr:FecR domain-containing protein [Bacteroidota bacterium]